MYIPKCRPRGKAPAQGGRRGAAAAAISRPGPHHPCPLPSTPNPPLPFPLPRLRLPLWTHSHQPLPLPSLRLRRHLRSPRLSTWPPWRLASPRPRCDVLLQHRYWPLASPRLGEADRLRGFTDAGVSKHTRAGESGPHLRRTRRSLSDSGWPQS